ncbi:putative phosphodiesterase [Dysgonomonas hofstadii]|uniref:Putative phosphodiesterase n=1 Tax=Dysgonomonas hofstadii TaxID=637886 RepID=A0A840CV40_9BACT|nr:metallophosphoesterase [Dysgonomonas hofstadii]MBB4036695.1 putative phosphodiesterase [Dysgonomonas hofstadii]
MKKLLFLFFVLFSAYGCVTAQSPVKLGVITDTHYLSEQLMDDSKAVEDYIRASGKNIKATPAVLNKVLNDYLNSDIGILLVCGDITKDGEKQSHLDFVKKLKPLQDNGIRVFVIPGNHDVNMPNSFKYIGDEKLPVANISSGEFEEIYADCGYNNAIKRDTVSLSYVGELNEKTWLLAIDAARYKEYKTASISAGKISPATETWILDVFKEAKSKDIQVIGMMHWGLTEHIMYQDTFFKDYLVDDWKRLANLFADNGMKVIFTGHFHSNDISLFTSDKGNIIYDVETGTLSSYPFAYRFVDLYPDRINIRTKNITEVSGYPGLAAEDKTRMQVLAKGMAVQKLRGLGFSLPADVTNQMADILSQIFVLHLYGDEKPDEALMTSLKAFSSLLDSSEDMDEMNFDFPPADNNVEIVFE